MSIGVCLVGFFLRHLDAEKRNQCGKDIGQRMNRVRNHCAGVSHDSGNQFERCQKDIAEDPYC